MQHDHDMFCPARSPQQAASDAAALLQEHFGVNAEGVWVAPGRVNLIGEHVDYAGGVCLPFALPHVTAAALHMRDDDTIRVVSVPPAGHPIEETVAFDAIGAGKPAGWLGYVAGSIWAAVDAGLVPKRGFDIGIVSDVPLGAGLSSSAALECSVIVGAYERATGKTADTQIKNDLIACAMRAENEVVGASTGGLDQTISLLGQKGHALAIDFAAETHTQVPADFAGNSLAIVVMNTNAPHVLADGQYGSRRGLIDTVAEALGTKHLAAVDDAVDQATAWAKRVDPSTITTGPLGENPEEAAELVARRVGHIVSETQRTIDAAGALKAQDWERFGELMNASHISLRDDYEVSCPELDLACETALEAGALGARMTGGGFGGSAIALIAETGVDELATSVTEAAKAHGFATPSFLHVSPSEGARKIRLNHHNDTK